MASFSPLRHLTLHAFLFSAINATGEEEKWNKKKLVHWFLNTCSWWWSRTRIIHVSRPALITLMNSNTSVIDHHLASKQVPLFWIVNGICVVPHREHTIMKLISICHVREKWSSYSENQMKLKNIDSWIMIDQLDVTCFIMFIGPCIILIVE